uniref:hypothetical protein n=1 Tax=uncultured Methanosphaera sp. TaxID=262501 RepID=UPI0028047BF0
QNYAKNGAANYNTKELQIYNTLFEKNHATEYGGCNYNDKNAELYLINLYSENNTAKIAADTYSYNATLIINKTQMKNNKADDLADNIVNKKSDKCLLINTETIQDNYNNHIQIYSDKALHIQNNTFNLTLNGKVNVKTKLLSPLKDTTISSRIKVPFKLGSTTYYVTKKSDNTFYMNHKYTTRGSKTVTITYPSSTYKINLKVNIK